MTKVSISIVDVDLLVDVQIKTEICELLTKFEAVEVGVHEVLANSMLYICFCSFILYRYVSKQIFFSILADSNEHIRRLNTIFTLLNKELTQMANNKHKKKLLTSSRRFKMHMDHFWKNFEDYELKFGTTHDNTEQNDKIIGMCNNNSLLE